MVSRVSKAEIIVNMVDPEPMLLVFKRRYRMKRIRFLGLFILLIIVLLLPAAVYASKPDARPNATNVELLKRVSVTGVPLPRGGGGPAGTPAASGILGSEVTGKRYAIIIGVSDYAGTDADLNYADDDAELVKETLIGLYHFEDNNIYLLLNDAATRDSILDKIAYLQGIAGTDDEVVFYYAGHGARGRADDGDRETVDEGIVPYEFTPDTVIWDGELKEAFSRFGTNRIVFIFDTCQAGGMTDLEADGRVILMASTENGYAAEPYLGQFPYHGLFTYALFAQGMQLGLADIYDNDANPETADVTVEEAFDYARYWLIGLSRATPILVQTPTISDRFVGDSQP